MFESIRVTRVGTLSQCFLFSCFFYYQRTPARQLPLPFSTPVRVWVWPMGLSAMPRAPQATMYPGCSHAVWEIGRDRAHA